MFGSLLALLICGGQTAQVPAKNVILMIADGTGFNSYAAAAMYDGRLGREVFNGPGWVQLAMSTYPLSTASKPRLTSEQDPEVVYDPTKAWAKDPTYPWLKKTATDSAASATTYGAGIKTYNSAICWSDMNEPATNVNDLFKSAGKSVGVVTTVQWSDATPSCFVAHNVARGNMDQIAQEMVEKSGVSVIMGAGHPWYDENGRRLEKMGDARPVGDRPYFTTPIDTFQDARLIETKADFEALAKGRLDMKGCTRLVGTVEANGTTQQERGTRDWNGDGKVDGQDKKVAPPFGDPLNKTVPSLSTMATGALNILSKNRKGFFLMVEGGAVDHANHANQPGRMIEEATEFFRAVETVDAWVARHGGWSKNLVMVTADHECGCLWGPNSDKIAFDPIVDNGKGKLPGMKHNSGGHTNSLIPIFARGPGASDLAGFATKTDPIRGKYLNNIDVFKVIRQTATGQ